MPGTPLLLQMEAIDKSFGENRVLKGAAFELRAGETHILAGENGAGKSTLMKILGGVHAPDAGTVRVNGAPVAFRTPHESRAAGIAMIHQEMSLVEGMSVADNLLLGEKDGWWLKPRRREARAREICARAGLELDVRRPVGELAVSARTRVEIAKALAQDASIVVMDEPTAALPKPDVLRLFRLISDLKAKGRGIVYISHRMEEIYGIGDRITVLRDGASVGTAPAAELPEPELVRWMIGRPSEAKAAAEGTDSSSKKAGGPVLEVEGLSLRGERGWVLKNVSFQLRAGEVLGVAGLQGSGNSELLATLFGAGGPPDAGRVRVAGAEHAVRGPAHSIASGMAYLTPDRKRTGLVLARSIRENTTLSALPRFTRAGWVLEGPQRRAARRRMEALRVRARGEDQAVGELSGGNQQKVALAKCLETEPRILLLDEPTRGVDVGAKHEIHGLIRQWTARGMAVLLISSEMPELLSLADRVIVLHRGELTATLEGRDAAPEPILRAAMGQVREAAS